MQGITNNVRHEIIRLLPLSLVEDVSCFEFYDHHPRDEKSIDIIVCTKIGELKEYFRRDIVSSINLRSSSAPTDLVIVRNSKCELFYIVSAGTELFVISTKANLKIHTKVMNVDRFTLDDSNCNGEISLKVFKCEDAVPIVFDENFKCVELLIHPPKRQLNHQPLATELKRKLIEAKYSVKNYEHMIQSYVRMRHKCTLQTYQNLHPNHSDSIFQSTTNIYGALKIKYRKPWVKVCNKKLVIALSVKNEYNEDIEDANILIHSDHHHSLCYTTKQFEVLTYLKEKESQKILPNQEAVVVAVLSLDELNVGYRIVLNVALSYNMKKVFLMPFDDIAIASFDILGDSFDVLSTSECDIKTMIAIQSTTVKTDLRMRDISSIDGEHSLSHRFQTLLIKHLRMQQAASNMLVYLKNPYHVLNGTVIHFLDGTDRSANVTVYTRSETQVLALVQCIMSRVPAKIVITTPNYLLTAKVPELAEFTESKPPITEQDYTEFAKTVISRTGLIIEYLDWAMVKMSESKDPEIVRQIGFRIDLYACGNSAYKEFRDKMKLEGHEGVKCLLREMEPKGEPMVLDE